MVRRFRSASTTARVFKAGVLDQLVPAAGDVQAGNKTWRPNGAAGTLTLPAVSTVLVGIQYGAAGTEFTGTLTIATTDDATESDFDDDWATVDDLFEEAFGQTVSFVGTLATVDVTAEVVERDYEIRDRYGSFITHHSRDYLIATADLAETPVEGHQVQETIDGTVHTFRVMPMGSRPGVEWADPRKRRWLLHTKLVEVAS